jgi:hypothetical protein
MNRGCWFKLRLIKGINGQSFAKSVKYIIDYLPFSLTHKTSFSGHKKARTKLGNLQVISYLFLVDQAIIPASDGINFIPYETLEKIMIAGQTILQKVLVLLFDECSCSIEKINLRKLIS